MVNAKEPLGSSLPPLQRQLVYTATGALAGAATLPIEILWSRFQRLDPHSARASKIFPSSRVAATTIGRASVRFWIFDHTRFQLRQHFPFLHHSITGGLSGAAGGFAEVCAESLVSARPHLPSLRALASQSARLFFCFGTYTGLSTALSPDELSPRPFLFCWALGAIAGGCGSGIVARFEGARGPHFWRNGVLKGSLVIGTVIAVQVTSCADALTRLES